jgi:osmotically-inducible protein OsmY
VTVTSTPTTDPYRLTGAITYNGTVSTTGKYFVIGATTNATLSGQMTWAYVNAAYNTPVSYTLNLSAAATYYVVIMLDSNIPSSDFNPSAGDAYTVYNGQSLAGTFTGIPVAGPTTQNFSFGSSNILGGLIGTLNYTGCKALNSNSHVIVQLYADSAYATPVSNGKIDFYSNGSISAAVPVTNVTAWAKAYLDLNGDRDLSSCEPYALVGPVTINTPVAATITLSDSNLYSCTTSAAFTGTISNTLGTISAAHPVYVRAYYYNTSYWQLAGMTSVACAGGSYSLAVTTGSGQYVLTAEYCSTTVGSSNDNQNPSVGNYYSTTGDIENYSNATQITYSGTTKTVNLNADKFQVKGYTGSVTYTGSKTLKDVCSSSNGPQIVVEAFDTSVGYPIQSSNLQGDFSCGEAASQGTYRILTNYNGATSSTYALKVFYDANGSGNLDMGDFYYDMGTHAPNVGSPVYNATVGDADLTAY